MIHDLTESRRYCADIVRLVEDGLGAGSAFSADAFGGGIGISTVRGWSGRRFDGDWFAG